MGPSWAFLGPSWGRLGAILGPSWRHLAKPWGPETLILLWFLQHLRSIDDLAPIFCSFSAILTYLSRSWAILAPSWAILGPSLAILGRLGAHLWAILGRLGAILGHLGAVLGPKLESQKTCLPKKANFLLRKLESRAPKAREPETVLLFDAFCLCFRFLDSSISDTGVRPVPSRSETQSGRTPSGAAGAVKNPPCHETS